MTTSAVDRWPNWSKQIGLDVAVRRDDGLPCKSLARKGSVGNGPGAVLRR
jgi:hypothetical protein